MCVCDLRMKEGKGLTSGWDSLYVCVCDLRREGVDINFLERGRVFTFLIFLYNDKDIRRAKPE